LYSMYRLGREQHPMDADFDALIWFNVSSIEKHCMIN
jgi:hypothetical protein